LRSEGGESGGSEWGKWEREGTSFGYGIKVFGCSIGITDYRQLDGEAESHLQS